MSMMTRVIHSNPPWFTLEVIQTFGAKLVLEVFGGGGAIWGFSEACGLRRSTNAWFWRPVALTVGFIFLLRWSTELYRSIHQKRNRDWRSNVVVHDEKEALVLPATALASPGPQARQQVVQGAATNEEA